MNLLPRVLGLALLLVLVALAVVLFGASNRSPASIAAPPDHSAPVPARVAEFSQRLALPLALTSLVLCAALLASLAMRSPRPSESNPPFAAARSEMGTLARLAENTVTQSRELARERDVRQRAEADALDKQQLLNRSLEEKIRLGRDLHDGLIQSLYAAGLTLESARSLVRSDPAEVERRLERCRETLNRSIREVRAYISGLAPDNLRNTDFASAIRSLFDELSAERQVALDLQIDDDAAAPLTEHQRIEILQLVREAISNSLRHGQASRLAIRLHPIEDAVCLELQDNGRGFSPAPTSGSGFGLRNMQARATGLGAELRIDSQPGNGTQVNFTLPLKA